jgi:hypothetical protein
MLVHRARFLYDRDSLHEELQFPRATFRQNSYSTRQIQQALNPLESVTLALQKLVSVAFLPFVSTTFNCFNRLLSRHINSVGLSPKEDSQFPSACEGQLGTRDSRHVSQVYVG